MTTRKGSEKPKLTKSSYAQVLKDNKNTFEKSKFNKSQQKQTQKKHKGKIKITQPNKSKTNTRHYLFKKQFKN